MFRNKMVTPAIPERVYTLCKVVENGALSSAEIKEKMEPSYLKQATSYFSDYKTAAEELGLVTTTDNAISLAVDPINVKSMDYMRYYINGQLDRFREGQFYKVTKAYYSFGADILRGEKNVAQMTSSIGKRTNTEIDPKNMHAWRFWATYLGFGYLQDMFVIPNAGVYLWDIIKRVDFERNIKYSIGVFLDKLEPYVDIIVDTMNINKEFCFGVSNGLRTLEKAGYLKTEHILDEEDTWRLYHMEALSVNELVTNVTILK